MGWEKVVHHRIKNLPYLIKAAGSLLTPRRLWGYSPSISISQLQKAGSFYPSELQKLTGTAIKLVIRLTFFFSFFLTYCADVFLTWDSHFTVTNPEKWLFWKVKRVYFYEFIGQRLLLRFWLETCNKCSRKVYSGIFCGLSVYIFFYFGIVSLYKGLLNGLGFVEYYIAKPHIIRVMFVFTGWIFDIEWLFWEMFFDVEKTTKSVYRMYLCIGIFIILNVFAFVALVCSWRKEKMNLVLFQTS